MHGNRKAANGDEYMDFGVAGASPTPSVTNEQLDPAQLTVRVDTSGPACADVGGMGHNVAVGPDVDQHDHSDEALAAKARVSGC